MRFWSLAAFGGLVMTTVAVAAFVFPREPRPGRLVPEPDFVVWRAADHDGADLARLVNTGDTPVRIRAVESGCDCAVPNVEPETIPPGDAGIVAVEAAPPEIGDRAFWPLTCADRRECQFTVNEHGVPVHVHREGSS